MHPLDVPSVSVDALPECAVLLDCRETPEWLAGHIDGALHVPMNEFPQRLSHHRQVLSPDTTIVVICKMGGRSAHVTAWLNGNGFDAVNLEGGMLAWASSGRSMVNENGQLPHVV